MLKLFFFSINIIKRFEIIIYNNKNNVYKYIDIIIKLIY